MSPLCLQPRAADSGGGRERRSLRRRRRRRRRREAEMGEGSLRSLPPTRDERPRRGRRRRCRVGASGCWRLHSCPRRPRGGRRRRGSPGAARCGRGRRGSPGGRGGGRLRGRSRRRLTLTGVARAPFLGRPGLARRVLTWLVWVSNGGWQPAGLAACVRARGFGPARTRATAEWVPAGQGRRRVGAAGVGRGTGFPACAEAALARASPPLPEPARRPPPALLKLEG